MRFNNVLSFSLSHRALKMRSIAIATAAASLALCAVQPLHAQAYGGQQAYPDPQQSSQQNHQADPPSRVGRLSLMQGDVSFQAAGVQDFSAAELNYPLTSGDRVYTGNGARAEIEAGQLTARLSAQADFTVTTLTDDLAQFGLAQGSAHLRLTALILGAD